MKFFPKNTLELTVALIKPHAVKIPPVAENIKSEILNNKFYIIRYQKCLMNLELAVRMYADHKGKPFYPRLIGHMTRSYVNDFRQKCFVVFEYCGFGILNKYQNGTKSGPIESFLLARENCITTWRNMMGLTRACETHIVQPMSLRGQYGLSNTRNVTHGSDSLHSAEKECSIFFPDFSLLGWYNSEEIFFRNGYVKFDESQFIHVKEKNDFPVEILK